MERMTDKRLAIPPGQWQEVTREEARELKEIPVPPMRDLYYRLSQIEDILCDGGDEYDLGRLRELVEADREDAAHIGACGFCEYYQMDKFCCCPDWVEDGYAIIRKPKDYCTKFKKAGWVDEVWGENGCPSCPGYRPAAQKERKQDG